MKRLIFLTTFDYPSRYAHATHGLHMACAFHQALGKQFLFVVNTDVNGTLADIPHRLLFSRYGRRIKKLHLRGLLLPWSMRRFFVAHQEWQGSDTTVFINDPKLIQTVTNLKQRFGVRYVFESHGLLDTASLAALARMVEKVIFVTPFLEQDALSKEPLLRGKTVVLPNAVDVAAFDHVSDDKAALRSELGLPDGFLIGYIGRFEPLGEDKGLRLMIDALESLLPQVKLVFVGGAKHETAQYQEFAKKAGVESRVTLVSHVPTEQVPRYAKACDALAYVPEGGTPFFTKETSPMKLFEYMAASRPIIISDLPTTRAVVPVDAAYFVVPGSRQSFVEAVRVIRENAGDAAARAKRARQSVEGNTWERRARRILS